MRSVSRFAVIALLALLACPAVAAQDNSQTVASFTPKVVAGIVDRNQTTGIPARTIFTPSSSGLYQVQIYWTVTIPGSGTSKYWELGLKWTDNAGDEHEHGACILDPVQVPPSASANCTVNLDINQNTPLMFYVNNPKTGEFGAFDLFMSVMEILPTP